MPSERSCRLRLWLRLWLVLWLVPWLSACSRPAPVPAAVDGVLDLRGWDAGRGPIELGALGGLWELYWGQLRDPREFSPRAAGGTHERIDAGRSWRGQRLRDGTPLSHQGHATMRLRVLLPRAPRGESEPWKLAVSPGDRAYRVHVRDGSGRALCSPLVAGVISAEPAAVRSFQRGELQVARSQLGALDRRDGPVRMYAAQCDHWLAQALPADFSGVLEIATK